MAGWIDENVAFPDSMVDRITPRSTLAGRELLARDYGVLDRWPVVTEPFSQWIVEDRFCNRRPPLDEVGVQFVDDVTPCDSGNLNARCRNSGRGYSAGPGQP